MMRWILLATMALVLGWPGDASADKVYKLRVDGLACPFCAYGVEKNLSKYEGVKDVEISVNEGVSRVTTEDDANFTEEVARKLIEDAGFTLRGFEILEAPK